MNDGSIIGSNDGTFDGKILGLLLRCTDGTKDGSFSDSDDGTLDGKALDGMYDGSTLGANDGQVPHVALQVWNRPSLVLHLFLFAIEHVAYFLL